MQRKRGRMEFEELLRQKIEEINKMIEACQPVCEGMQKQVIEAMNYSLNAGGKRVRPLLLAEVYRLCGGGTPKEIAPFMAALEWIHTYSLVHDDLPAMDNDDYRRGQLTTHKKYGEAFGILAGDGLLNYAYELLFLACAGASGDGKKQQRAVSAASVIARKAGIYGMIGGQTLDVQLTGKAMEREELDFIFRLKTGALIEAAFMAGAILAGADDAVVSKLEEAGRLIGVAFQIQDDILDVTSTREVLGKPVFSDEKNQKTTYVTLYGMEKAKADVKELSGRAIASVEELGDNPFLIMYLNQLINREK